MWAARSLFRPKPASTKTPFVLRPQQSRTITSWKIMNTRKLLQAEHTQKTPSSLSKKGKSSFSTVRPQPNQRQHKRNAEDEDDDDSIFFDDLPRSKRRAMKNALIFLAVFAIVFTFWYRRKTIRDMEARGIRAPRDGGLSLFTRAERSARVLWALAMVTFDYKYQLRGLEENTPEYLNRRKEVNLRSAQRLLKICMSLGGFYVKVGQIIASFNFILPKEYTETLSKLQDKTLFMDPLEVWRVVDDGFSCYGGL